MPQPPQARYSSLNSDRRLSPHQHCRCEPENEERIPGYDFPTATELCRCCGGQLVRSGSRYPFWFCDPCLELVRGFNNQIASYAIPVGRHSFHGRLALSTAEPEQHAVASDFVERMGSWLERLDWIDAWDGAAVRHNRAMLGMGTGDLALLTYLATFNASIASERSSEDGFARMVAAL